MAAHQSRRAVTALRLLLDMEDDSKRIPGLPFKLLFDKPAGWADANSGPVHSFVGWRLIERIAALLTTKVTRMRRLSFQIRD